MRSKWERHFDLIGRYLFQVPLGLLRSPSPGFQIESLCEPKNVGIHGKRRYIEPERHNARSRLGAYTRKRNQIIETLAGAPIGEAVQGHSAEIASQLPESALYLLVFSLWSPPTANAFSTDEGSASTTPSHVGNAAFRASKALSLKVSFVA